MTNETQQNGGDAKKDHQKFMQVVDQINAILGENSDLLKGSNKVPGDKLGEVVGKLAAKRREKSIDDFSVELDALIDSYITFERDSDQKRKEMEKAIAEKEKEFTKKAQSVLGKIKDLGEYMKSYHAALSRTVNAAEEAQDPAAGQAANQ